MITRNLILLAIIFITGCSSSPRIQHQPLENQPGPEVIIIPTKGIDDEIVNYVVDKIKEQHMIDVEVTTKLSLQGVPFDRLKNQFEVYTLASKGINKARAAGYIGFRASIVLTDQDLNIGHLGKKYIIGADDKNHDISIISYKRLDPRYYLEARDDALLHQRLMKVVNKALGLHLYEYDYSDRTDSVMYSPVYGVHKLDAIGVWY